MRIFRATIRKRARSMAAGDVRSAPTSSVRSPRAVPGWQQVAALLAGLAALLAFALLGWGGLAIVIACYAVAGAALLAWLHLPRRGRKSGAH